MSVIVLDKLKLPRLTFRSHYATHFQTRTALLSTSILVMALQYALMLAVQGLSQILISTFLATDDYQQLAS